MEDVSKYVGILHEHNSSSFDACNCIGLCALFYREHGWPQTFSDGCPVDDEHGVHEWRRLFRYMKKDFTHVSYNDLAFGDVVVFKVLGDMHLGIYLEYGKLLTMQVPVCYGETKSTIYHRAWWERYYRTSYRRKE